MFTDSTWSRPDRRSSILRLSGGAERLGPVRARPVDGHWGGFAGSGWAGKVWGIVGPGFPEGVVARLAPHGPLILGLPVHFQEELPGELVREIRGQGGVVGGVVVRNHGARRDQRARREGRRRVLLRRQAMHARPRGDHKDNDAGPRGRCRRREEG